MAKNLIIYNGRKYVFNRESFKKKMIPEDCTESLKQRINKMIEQEGMTVSFETVKAWYYGNNGTDDIENLKKAAHFLDTEVTAFLSETDEIWECIQDANSYSEERTLLASLANIKNWMMTAAKDTPGYKERKGILGIIDRYPSGLPCIFIIYVINSLLLWVLDIEVLAMISPLMLLLLMEWGRFLK